MSADDPRACCDRIELGVPARRANALNIEVGKPAARCRLRTPEHWGNADQRGARWLLSGGSPLVLEPCSASDCPKRKRVACPDGCGNECCVPPAAEDDE